MSLKIILHDDAFDDLDVTSAYIGEGNPRASVRFLEAAQKEFAEIAEAPGRGAPRDYNNSALVGMRMSPVPGFPKYGIYYLTTQETVEILRVLHGARDLDAIFAPQEQANGARE